MPVFFNGNPVTTVFFNGSPVTSIFFNGSAVPVGGNSAFGFTNQSYISEAAGIVGVRSGAAFMSSGNYELYGGTNATNPQNSLAGNRINPYGLGNEWPAATVPPYAMSMKYQYWVSGGSVQNRDTLEFSFYVEAADGQPSNSQYITVYVDGAQVFKTTLLALVNTYGFVWTGPGSGGTYYSGAPNTFNQSKALVSYTLAYTGPQGSAGNATVRGWITALFDGFASDSKERLIVLSDN